jgi:hypothetical protein
MMPSPSIVRPAVPADENEIWRLFRLHHEENALYPLSERKVQFYLDRVLRPENIEANDAGPRGVIGVIGDTGALEGAIMLVLGSAWYTDQIGIDDCMNFVDPAHRHSDHAKALISFAKHIVDCIRAGGYPDFRMIVGVISTVRTAAKIRFFSRQVEPIGAYFMYPPIEGVIPLKKLHKAG